MRTKVEVLSDRRWDKTQKAKETYKVQKAPRLTRPCTEVREVSIWDRREGSTGKGKCVIPEFGSQCLSSHNSL